MLKTRDAVRMEEQFRIAQAGESAPISSRQATLLVVAAATQVQANDMF
jgi:hypothetical protein